MVKARTFSMAEDSKPDVAQLMTEIEDLGRKLDLEPRRSGFSSHLRGPPQAPPQLEESWDVWVMPPLSSHRGWRGRPVVWVKKALLFALKLHNRELLRRQREFNRAVKDELTVLQHRVGELQAQLADLQRPSR
jgi:hypothetical protein